MRKHVWGMSADRSKAKSQKMIIRAGGRHVVNKEDILKESKSVVNDYLKKQENNRK